MPARSLSRNSSDYRTLIAVSAVEELACRREDADQGAQFALCLGALIRAPAHMLAAPLIPRSWLTGSACFISSFSLTAPTPRSLNSCVATVARRFPAACSLETPDAGCSIGYRRRFFTR